ILALTKRLKQSGGRYIFVSDIYLPREVLAEWLADAGYPTWDALYVSSEVGHTKATGNIWYDVAAHHPLKLLLHIGDDSHSDVSQPASLGIATIPYERARSERRITSLNPSLLPFSLLQRRQQLRKRQSLDKPITSKDDWYTLGRSMGALVL